MRSSNKKYARIVECSLINQNILLSEYKFMVLLQNMQQRRLKSWKILSFSSQTKYFDVLISQVGSARSSVCASRRDLWNKASCKRSWPVSGVA
jgi:hypothetical protein